MTDKIKKKFPWVRYLFNSTSMTLWMLFVLTDFELAFVGKDESSQIASVLFLVYILSAPRRNKKKLSQEKLSIWTKDINTITWTDLNTEFIFVSLRWSFLLITFVSILYSVGITVIESMFHNMIAQLSFWAWLMVEKTKSCVDWQRE